MFNITKNSPGSTTVVFGLLLPTIMLAQQLAPTSGKVVKSTDGSPIARASVLAIASPDKVGGAPTFVRTETSMDGTFTLNTSSGVTYAVCVHNGGAYLNPCDWGQPVEVRVGSVPTPLIITLVLGVPLRVRVADPNGLLGIPAPSAKATPPPVSFSIKDSTTGALRPLPFLSWANGKLEYFIVLPQSRSFQVVVDNTVAQLKDAVGTIYTVGATVAVPSMNSIQSTGMFSKGSESSIQFSVSN